MLFVVISKDDPEENDVAVGPFLLEEAKEYQQKLHTNSTILPLWFDSSKPFKWLLSKDEVHEMANCISDCELFGEDLDAYVEDFLKDKRNG